MTTRVYDDGYGEWRVAIWPVGKRLKARFSTREAAEAAAARYVGRSMAAQSIGDRR